MRFGNGRRKRASSCSSACRTGAIAPRHRGSFRLPSSRCSSSATRSGSRMRERTRPPAGFFCRWPKECLMEFKDYYQTLGVARDATQDEIKKAYRKLARKYHPDVSKEKDAEARMKEINEAQAVLSDPEKRA